MSLKKASCPRRVLCKFCIKPLQGEAGPLEGRIEGVGEGRSGIISRVEHVERVEG